MLVTINYGSMNAMKIRKVKKDYDDFSMSLNLFMLSAANADFDGDTLNILALKTEHLKDEFNRIFNPNENHAISKLDGLFNTEIDLLKDSSIAIFDFCTIE